VSATITAAATSATLWPAPVGDAYEPEDAQKVVLLEEIEEIFQGFSSTDVVKWLISLNASICLHSLRNLNPEQLQESTEDRYFLKVARFTRI